MDCINLYITVLLPANVDLLVRKPLVFPCVHKLRTIDKYIKTNTAISKTPKGETGNPRMAKFKKLGWRTGTLITARFYIVLCVSFLITFMHATAQNMSPYVMIMNTEWY
jgi:hypothetical protein